MTSDHREIQSSEGSENSIEKLLKENKELKDKLEKYKSLEEELTAQRVFERAKQKLTAWLTIGGIGTIIVGWIGFNQIEDYTQKLVKSKVDSVAVQKLNDLIERDVSITVTSKEPYINTQIAEQIGRYIASQPITGLSASHVTSSQPLMFDPRMGSVDYSPEMTPVRNQGSEGSAVAFAVAAALEYQVFKKTGEHITISTRDIYYLSRKKEGTNNTDAGAQISDAIEALKSEGAVREQAWPYEPGQFASKPPTTLEQAEKYKITVAQRVKTLDDLKGALQKYGPFVAGIAVYNSFESAAATKTGYLPEPSPGDNVFGGHAICIVGYDDAKKQIKFRNSWGSQWGDKGYGYISYDYFQKLSDDNWAFSL
jgi:C1A family cysteine protease